MPPVVALDPLGPSADPRRYVPLASSERALDGLRASVEAGRSPILLRGASGIGKTLLLRVLADRELCGGRRVVFSPFLHLPPDDVAPWLLHLLARPLCAGTSAEQLLSALRPHGASRTLLIVDEIQSAPEASVRRLKELARATSPTLALVVAGRRARNLQALLPALSPAEMVSLPDRLPAEDMRELCDALLERPGLDPEIRRLGADERDALVRRARGVPAQLKGDLLRFTAKRVVSRAFSGSQSRAVSKPYGVTRPASEKIPSASLAPAPAPVRADALALPDTRAPRRPAAARIRGAAWRAASRAGRRATASVVGRVAAWNLRGRIAPVIDLTVSHTLPLAVRGRALAQRESLAVLLLLRRGCARAALEAAIWRRVLARAWEALDLARLAALALSEAGGAAARAGAASAATAVAWLLERGRATQLRARRELPWRAARALELSALGARRARERIAAPLGAAAFRARGAQARLGARLRAAASGARSAKLRLSAPLRAAGSQALEASRPAWPLFAAALLIALLAGRWYVPEPPPPPPPPSPPRSASIAPIRVQVNASPWAVIRIDGVSVGPTPLSHPLTPGRHEFEAEFSDGRLLRRHIEVGPERRMVSLR